MKDLYLEFMNNSPNSKETKQSNTKTSKKNRKRNFTEEEYVAGK